MNVLSSALQGVMTGMNQLAGSAGRVARMGVPPKQGEKEVNLAEEAAIRITADATVRANLNVIRNEDERLGYLLDIFA